MLKIIISAFLFAMLVIMGPVYPSDQPHVAFVGATLFTSPDAKPVEKGVIIITGNRITAVGPVGETAVPDNAKVVDVSGQFVTAGFWNSHVHYTGRFESAAVQDDRVLGHLLLDTFLRWGFVNTVDTGSWLEKTLIIRDRIENGEVNGPRILIAGGSFVPESGSPYYIKPLELSEFHNPGDARQKVRNVLNQGADAIKLFTGSWATPEQVVVMRPGLVRAATTAAHENGALVFAHPSDSDGARVAIENGVDILAHVFPAQFKGPWDQSLPGKLARAGMAVVPTLKLWRVELTKEGLPPRLVEKIENTAIAQTRAIHDAGVPILFGTDVGYMQDADTTEEFRLMARAGMDHRQILESLTTAPAARYGYSETSGKIKQQYVADLVFLRVDPRQNVQAFSDITRVMRDGKLVYAR